MCLGWTTAMPHCAALSSATSKDCRAFKTRVVCRAPSISRATPLLDSPLPATRRGERDVRGDRDVREAWRTTKAWRTVLRIDGEPSYLFDLLVNYTYALVRKLGAQTFSRFRQPSQILLVVLSDRHHPASGTNVWRQAVFNYLCA